MNNNHIMARLLHKDPTTYGKERDSFMRDLHRFHVTRGTPFRRCPAIGGYEIDLYTLYSLVTAQGGWMKVNARNEWESLFEQFDLPSKCVNNGVALKQIYIRYLDRYEKVHYLGEEADRASDEDEENRHKRWSARALHSVPLSYNYHQHNIADSTRSYNGLSDQLYKASDYDRLALSLISPLPNEQDFAVNVCTLLCNEGKHTLKLDKCPRIVDYLLAHAGVFNNNSLRSVFNEVYAKIRKHSLNHFWYDLIESTNLADLIDENNFTFVENQRIWIDINSSLFKRKTKTINGDEEKDIESQVKSAVSECDSDSDSELFAPTTDETTTTKTQSNKFKLKLEANDKELFCTGRTLGTQDYVGQRVVQIAQILRNLSFINDNMSVLGQNRTFVRFLLLCVNSKWNQIHQLGLDMLSNVAGEIVLKEQHDRLTDCLMHFVVKSLFSCDRVVIITCLEILNKLSQNEDNEDFLLRGLETKTYAQVCSFLTLHDVMLLIYTLECLYALSSLGERACNCIVEVHGIIDTLVSLVTVEGKSYGPKACIGMKLVETVPGVTAAAAVSGGGAAVTVPSSTIVQTTTATITQLSSSSSPAISMQTSSATTTPIGSTPVKASPAIVARTIASASTKQNTTPVQSVVLVQQQQTPQQQQQQQQQSSTTQQLIQQQHAHQQAIQENEQFALAWLRATYEPCGHGKLEQQELYKQYLNSCGKIGRRGVIAPLHFPRCVRSVFGGTVGPNVIKGQDQNLLFYEGIRARIVPLIITLPSAALQQTIQNKFISSNQRRGGKIVSNVIVTTTTTNTTTNIVTTDNASVDKVPNSPASPILKAQLSAPPKPRESPTKIDVKSPVLSHPHLSQALLGTNVTTNATLAVTTATFTSSGTTGLVVVAATPSASIAATSNSIGTASTAISSIQSNTSLIKSLLATKVNECMQPHTVSMKTTATALAPAAATVVAANATVLTTDNSQNTPVAQVAQRQQQQRLLAQQNQQQTSGIQTFTTINKKVLPKPQPQPKNEPKTKVCRLNGLRLQENNDSSFDNVSSSSTQQILIENHISTAVTSNLSGGGANSAFRVRREPPQPPPPPLAPLSSNNNRAKTPRMDIEDSDSTGNNSVASSTGIGCSGNLALSGGISSTEDGDNSLTSFEGILLNGIPNSIDIDAPCNEDSNSKDSIGCRKKPLMLADLLEKKVEKDPPILNGIIGKELRIGEKGLELVDNHINKILSKDITMPTPKEVSVIVSSESECANVRTSPEVNSVCNNNSSVDEIKSGKKRSASEDISEPDTKKRNVSSPTSSVIVSNNVNGVESPKPESVDSYGDDSGANVSVSATAANLYASFAADVLEDEDEELLQQEAENNTVVPVAPPVEEPPAPQQLPVVAAPPPPPPTPIPIHQMIAMGGQPEQQLLVAAPRQIIVSQGQIQSASPQVLITAGGQIALQQATTQAAAAAALKSATGHQTMPVLVQTGTTGQRAPMILTQSNATPILVSHGPQGQVQLVASGGQQGQYVLSAGGAQGTHYVVAQPQTALIQGQAQTVLVAQTPQQQGTPSKTIIILQPQTTMNTASHHQKVMVTPQGQQVVVTQVQRPILQSSTVTNNIPPALISSNIQQQQQQQQQQSQIQNSTVVAQTACPTVIKATPTAVLAQNASSIVNAVVQNVAAAAAAAGKLIVSKDKTSVMITNNTTASTITATTASSSNVDVKVTSIPLTVVTTVTTTSNNLSVSKVVCTVAASTSSQSIPVTTQPTVIRDFSNPFVCEWRGCASTKKFKSANEVYMHACEAHCPEIENSEELQCLWERCDSMKRKRYSLMTHLHDRHCSPEIMKMMATRRKQLSQSGKTEISAPTPTPPHPGYAPDAALHAIKRHALEFVNPKELQQKGTSKPGTTTVAVTPRPANHSSEQDDNEGPVTKSIRLTASLILRNLVIYSNNSRRYLRHYEPHLAGVALSNVESSRTIAQLLYDLNDTSTAR